jgi:AbrB family looped-hinge helix DNA binding protein
MGIEVKMAANGRVIIPADVRKALGIEGGGSLMLELTDDALTLRTRAQRLATAKSMAAEMLKGVEGSAVDALIADRRAEFAREYEQERALEQAHRGT